LEIESIKINAGASFFNVQNPINYLACDRFLYLILLNELLLFFWVVKPDIFTATAIPRGRNPFLFSMHWVFMTEQASKFHVTVWAFSVIRFLIFFSTDGVHQGVRSYGVKEVAVSTTPSSGYPFSFPLNSFILI
jgi:hypothetical protein